MREEKEQQVAKTDGADKNDADGGKVLHPVISWENLQLLLFTCFIIWVNCTYQKLMMRVYSTESWHFFDHVMKVLMNHFAFWNVERGLARNIVFNTLRCMPDEFIVYYVYGTIVSPELLLYRLLSIWALTWATHYCVDRRAARKNPNTWSIFFIFFVCSFGIGLHAAISRCEHEFSGDLSRLVALTVAFVVNYFYADLIEDFIFGDLYRWGGLWHNWSYFVHPILLVISSYTLMHKLHGDEVHGAWRHGNKPIAEAVMTTGQSPLVWPVLRFEENETAHIWVVISAVMSYGIPTLYYQIKWKRSIR